MRPSEALAALAAEEAMRIAAHPDSANFRVSVWDVFLGGQSVALKMAAVEETPEELRAVVAVSDRWCAWMLGLRMTAHGL